MLRRVCNVLLVANPYDAFMLEDDGRIDEKIFSEYARLGLRFPPRFIQVASMEEAEVQMAQGNIDLVICMPAAENNNVFQIARSIKEEHATTPIVVLTPFSHGITRRMQNEDLSAFEYVFCWLGNTELLLSIIKLIEDKMNLEHDIQSAGVQMIMVVEDSIRFYSSILPSLYKFVLQQSLEFSTEALNTSLETLRMRGRPKIVLARNYEEAWDLYSRFADNTLGVISDCRFPMDASSTEKAPDAGYKLLSAIRAHDPYIPLIMDSSESGNIDLAKRCHAHFIDKNSKKMDVDLRERLNNFFGFGDFVFRNPDTMEETVRIRNLKDLQNHIMTVPAKSLLYHITHNNVSRWLASRALFPIAEFLRGITWESLKDVDAHRQIIFDAIVAYRRMKNQGVVAVFQRERFDQYSNFARIGDGSLGGKGRGLAFLDHVILRHPDLNDFPGAQVQLPKTVVLCTDVFDEFMEQGDLYPLALSEAPDDEILSAFLRASFPERLRAAVPGATLRTTCMVGFPGETEEHFQALLDYIQRVRFDALGTFIFSPEAGTAAAALPALPPPEVARDRLARLMSAQRAIAKARNRERVGTTARALILSRTPTGGALARLPHQAPEVDGLTRLAHLPEGVNPGDFLPVTLTGTRGYDLTARAQ